MNTTYRAFAIEFKATAWAAGVEGNPNAEPDTYRVLVDDIGARAFVATSADFGGWKRVDESPQPSFRAIAPLSGLQIIALALRGYHEWWMARWRPPCGMEPGVMVPPGPEWGSPDHGIPVFNIGTIRDRMGTR